jgi:hypothetical protein
MGMMMRRRSRTFVQCLVSIAVVAASVVHAAGQHYEGYAYAAGDGKLLYLESHWQYTENNIERHLVVYRCANGEPFARKHLDTATGAVTPDFDMLDARSGYREGVRTRQGPLPNTQYREVFEQIDARAPERRAPLTVPRNAVIDAGLDAFVRAQWNVLSDTGVSPVPILVPSRLGYMDFSARKLRDERVGGNDVRWFRLSLSALAWIGFAIPHIEVGYDTLTRERREYRGLTDIRGDDNRNLNVRIDFPPAERRTDITLADVARAAETPLTGRCLFH